MISRGTDLSEVFASIPLLSQAFTRHVQINFGFQAKLPRHGREQPLPVNSAESASDRRREYFNSVENPVKRSTDINKKW